MVVPRFVGQALQNLPITIFGDGLQTRCFCYVGDVVDGLVALSEHADAVGQVFNICGTEEISIRDLALRIIELAGTRSALEFIPYDVAYEEGFEDMVRRVPNTERAKRMVGVEPSVNLDDIIRLVIDDHQV